MFVFHRNPGHERSLYDCLLHSMVWVQSVDDKSVFVFVSDANFHHSKWWSQFLLLIDMSVMLLISAICQVVSCWFAVPLTLLVIDSI